MARDVKKREEHPAGLVELSRDIHDNPEQTDRWIVNAHVRFSNESTATEFMKVIIDHIKLLPHHMRDDVRIDLRAVKRCGQCSACHNNQPCLDPP